MSRDLIVLKRYVGDGYVISQTCTHSHNNEHDRITEKSFERDGTKGLLSLDFDGISEIFVEEKTIKSFVQDATAKVRFL